MKLFRVLSLVAWALVIPFMAQAQGEAQDPAQYGEESNSVPNQRLTKLVCFFAVRSAKACQSQTPLPIWHRR